MDHIGHLAEVFNDSYERVMRSSGEKHEFFQSFYDRLIATNSEAARLFEGRDLGRIIWMLRTSVTSLLALFATGQQDAALVKVAELHGRRGVNVPSHLYSVWLECLLITVQEFDSRFTPEVEKAWRAVFSKGIEFIALSANQK